MEAAFVKISTQIALSYFLIVGLAAYFFLAVFIHDIKPGVTQSVEETLVDTSNILAELAAADLKSGRIKDGPFAQALEAYGKRSVDASIWGLHKTSLDYRVYVTDSHGIVVFDSANRDLGADFSRWNDVYLSLRGRYGARSTPTDPQDPKSAVMHVAAPVLDQGRVIGVLTVAKPDSTIEPFIERAQTTVRGQGAALLLAAAAIGFFFAWRLTRSIERLRRYARDVSGGARVPLPATMNREIAELGQALEGMRERLDGKEYVEEYVHALTHEIKSPVAAIQGAAELLAEEVPSQERQRFAGNILEQADRIRLIVDRLLELAKIEHLHSLSSNVAVDVAGLVRQQIHELADRLASRELRCEIQGTAPAVHGDPFLIEQALRNLLENAIDFSPKGGEIRVILSESADHCQVEVRDSGPGIPDYAMNRIFERFYSLPRPDSGKKSTGLGLALVREVAKLHRGEIRLENAAEIGVVAHLSIARG
jgi:two-component system sensor histidine kinase CreC